MLSQTMNAIGTIGLRRSGLVLTLLFWLLSAGASRAQVASEDDHGNNASTSTPVGAPSSTAGDIEVGTDVDWFRFSALAGLDYDIETTLGSLPDTTLTLFDTDGVSQLEFDDDGGLGLASRITWTPPGSGTYYLQVSAFSAAQTGTYWLQLSVDGFPPPASLYVNIVLASISEIGGTSDATVTRIPGTSGALTVTLTSSDTTEATVPATQTIPDGSASAAFLVTAVDDALVDGPQTVTITASAAGAVSGSDSVEVLDNELLLVGIPSLSTWGLVILCGIIGLLGARIARKQYGRSPYPDPDTEIRPARGVPEISPGALAFATIWCHLSLGKVLSQTSPRPSHE